MGSSATDPNVRQLASKIVVNLNENANDIDSRLIANDLDVDLGGTGRTGRGPCPYPVRFIAQGAG